jgi:hypothetical protein
MKRLLNVLDTPSGGERTNCLSDDCSESSGRLARETSAEDAGGQAPQLTSLSFGLGWGLGHLKADAGRGFRLSVQSHMLSTKQTAPSPSHLPGAAD